MKKILTVISIFIIFIFAFFIFEKFFPSEVYVIKSIFSNNHKNSFPISENYYEEEYTDLNELIKNGAEINDSLMLINSEHPLPKDYSPDLVDLGGIYINSCAEKAYKNLSQEIKNSFNNSLYIMSAFRTLDEQIEILESGNEYAASADSSEHLSGLALDVYVKHYAGMGFLDSEEGQFVNSFCHDYGFIIRYPYYGEHITKIPFEPWHIRYVGLPHSKIIAENNLTLEEYIESFIPNKIYYYEDYFIFRGKADSLLIPKGFSDITISPDNTGYYIITGKH